MDETVDTRLASWLQWANVYALRQSRAERLPVAEALRQAQSIIDNAEREQRDIVRNAVKEIGIASAEPQRKSIPCLKAPQAHVVCPRDIKVEDDKGALVYTTVRKLVRVHTGCKRSRQKFSRFIEQTGARVENLEREDGNVSLPPDDFRVFHDEDDGVSRPANGQEMRAGQWPETIWFLIDCTPDALAFLCLPSTRWAIAIDDDCPVNPPRMGTGQTAK